MLDLSLVILLHTLCISNLLLDFTIFVKIFLIEVINMVGFFVGWWFCLLVRHMYDFKNISQHFIVSLFSFILQLQASV